MSWSACDEPEGQLGPQDKIEHIIVPRTGDIGNFKVHRALPFRDKRMVGPFIFWDQMGPGEFIAGQGVDVRPHPHIGLSTVTYLFDGTMDHKDSVGNDMRIVPGDVNLMTAGAGIVHSERTGQDIRLNPSKLYGIQSWLAQPKEHENGANNFVHTAKEKLPVFDADGTNGRVILGDFQGLKSPVDTQWETLYVEAFIKDGQRLLLPKTTEERAIYVLEGNVTIEGHSYPSQQMIVLSTGHDVVIKAEGNVHMMILGGAAMDGPRHIWWNFVSSSQDQIEQAKLDWKAGKFGTVPGDEVEFIPLPD